MSDKSKSKAQLLAEIAKLRKELSAKSKAHLKLENNLNRISETYLQYKHMIDSIPEPMVIVQDNIHKYASPAFTKLLGYTQKDIKKGLNFSKLLHPNDLKISQKRNNDRLAGKKISKTFLMDIIAKNGKVVPCETYASVIDYDDRPAVMVILRDVSERLILADSLFAAEQDYRKLVDTMQEGLGVIDENGMITYVNNRICDLLGYSEIELIGKPLFFLIPEEDIEYAKDSLGKHSQGQSINQELRLLKKDGSILTVIASSKPLFDSNSGFQGSFSVLTDITEFKQTTEAFQSLVENSLQGLLIIQDDKVVLSNKMLSTISGYSAKDFEAKISDIMGFVHPDYRDEIMNRYKARVEGDTRPALYEFKGIRKDGSDYWAEIYVSSIEYKGKPASQAVLIDITDRKMAEESRRESEEQFRQLSEQSPNMIFINKNGKVVFANAQCEQIMGYSIDEFLAPDFDFMTLIHPDYYDLINRNMAKHFKGESIQPYEYVLLTKQGKKLDVIITTKMINFMGGPSILGILTDITDRIVAEKKLRDSEDKFRSITEHAIDFIFIKDIDRKYTFINKAFEGLLGLPEEEIIGKTPDEIFGREQGQIIKEVDDLTFSGETVNRTRSIIINDKEVFINTIQTPLTVSDGEVTSILGVVRDITEYKQAEDRINFLSQVTMQVTDSIITTDLDFRITYVNRAFQKLYGYSEEEIIGKSPSTLNVSKNADKIQAEIYEAVSTGVYWRGEVMNRRKDGSDFPCELTIYPLINENGKIFSYAGNQRDITEQKRFEEQLKQTSIDLKRERGLLETKNIALREILSQIETEKNAIKHQMITNIEKILIPPLQRLKESCPSHQKKHIEHLEKELKSVSVPIGNSLPDILSKLTPREVEICGMIRNGFLSKEIAEILNISVLTVNKHREMIRKKLGITNKEVNLNTFLQSK